MANFEVIGNKYIRCNPAALIVKSEGDAGVLIEKAFQHRKILIFQSNLAPDFFDLSTGFAGNLLQKFVNYNISAAFVVDLATIRSGRFKEMAMESNTMDEYRFFEKEEDAVKWLIS